MSWPSETLRKTFPSGSSAAYRRSPAFIQTGTPEAVEAADVVPVRVGQQHAEQPAAVVAGGVELLGRPSRHTWYGRTDNRGSIATCAATWAPKPASISRSPRRVPDQHRRRGERGAGRGTSRPGTRGRPGSRTCRSAAGRPPSRPAELRSATDRARRAASGSEAMPAIVRPQIIRTKTNRAKSTGWPTRRSAPVSRSGGVVAGLEVVQQGRTGRFPADERRVRCWRRAGRRRAARRTRPARPGRPPRPAGRSSPR